MQLLLQRVSWSEDAYGKAQRKKKFHTKSKKTHNFKYDRNNFVLQNLFHFFLFNQFWPLLRGGSGRGSNGVLRKGAGQPVFRGAGPRSAGRPSLRRISCVAKHIIHLGSWFWKKFHKIILFKWLRPLWQNLCLFMKVVLVKYFLHFSQNLRF